MIPRGYVAAMVSLIAFQLLVGGFTHGKLPDPAPIHWNIRGEVDGYGPRWLVSYLFTLVNAALAALLAVLPLLGPFRSNLERSRSTYGRICLTVIAGCAALHMVLIRNAGGWSTSLATDFCIVIGLMLALIGNWLSKVPRNFYVGIRTPWTLANETVWDRTHRLGARLFVAVGLIAAVVGLFAPPLACFIVLIGGIGVVTLWAVLYSLLLYRRLGQVDDLSG